MEEKVLYKIHITGRVQRVGFRWSAANEAITRGITGYVKNLSDGSVFIEAEGSRNQLNAFIKWCRDWPGPGFVDNVSSELFSPVNYEDFRIEH